MGRPSRVITPGWQSNHSEAGLNAKQSPWLNTPEIPEQKSKAKIDSKPMRIRFAYKIWKTGKILETIAALRIRLDLRISNRIRYFSRFWHLIHNNAVIAMVWGLLYKMYKIFLKSFTHAIGQNMLICPWHMDGVCTPTGILILIIRAHAHARMIARPLKKLYMLYKSLKPLRL